MTNEQFAALVAKLEEEVRRNPRGYQFKVLLLALLGDAYLGVILLVIVASLVAAAASVLVLKAAAIKIIVPLGVFLLLVLKAVWIRLPPPQGITIEQGQSPALFAMIEELRQALDAPHFDHVLITEDFNAGVVQTPTLGMFGAYENYLLIGLPLMKSLTVEQFKAVLAHEFGHLAKGHGRLSNWIYRQRLRWGRLMGMLAATESKGSFLFKPFINWFAPYFNAYSFPLARANEYEADAAAVRLTSPVAAAAALTNVNVIGAYLAEQYWPQIHRQADDHPQPAFTPFSNMSHRVSAELDEMSTRQWLDQAMARQTTLDDTHPALNERLKAIGETPRLAPPLAGEAADRLLGDALHAISEHLDQRWKNNILAAWEQRHREVQENRSRLAELDARYESGVELTLQDALDRARLTESVGKEPDRALEQFRALYERASDNAVVCFSLGERLLARDDDAGCAMVEQAMQLDEDATLRVCGVLRDYHWRNGRADEAQTWHQRLIERAQLEEAATKERQGITLRDTLEPHGLPDSALEGLREQLRSVPRLEKAYFARKRVEHLAYRPLYVLAFSAEGPFGFHSRRCSAEVLQRIHETIPFPGATLIVDIDTDSDTNEIGRRIRALNGARVL